MQQLRRRLLSVWGNGEHGRLGLDGVASGRLWPQICDAIEGVQSVVCGGAHTVVLTNSGKVWSFGLNSAGQLGHSPRQEFCSRPRRIDLPEAVKQVAAGHFHTLCLTASGTVWGFGSNQHGQLGTGARAGATPTKIDNFEGVAVGCGALHSMGVTASGEVYAWGSNQHGQLGYAQKLFESVKQWEPRLLRDLRHVKVRSLAMGHVCSGAVDEDGNVFTWGSNQFWQLGRPSTDHIAPMPAHIEGLVNGRRLCLGGTHALCLMENGTAFVWGTNENGCLGPAFPKDLDPEGDALIETVISQPRLLSELKLVDASLGWRHSGGIAPDGTLYMWGWGGTVGEATYLLENYEGPGGQLGHGTDFDAWAPVRIHPPEPNLRFHALSCGLNHTAAILELSEEA